MYLLKSKLGSDNNIAGSGLHQLIQRSAITVPWQRHMSHTTLSFCYWACNNMAAAYWQWRSDDTMDSLLAFSNSLLLQLEHCNVSACTTQHNTNCIYIQYSMYVQYKLELETVCPALHQRKAVGALTLYNTVVTVCTEIVTFRNFMFC